MFGAGSLKNEYFPLPRRELCTYTDKDVESIIYLSIYHLSSVYLDGWVDGWMDRQIDRQILI